MFIYLKSEVVNGLIGREKQKKSYHLISFCRIQDEETTCDDQQPANREAGEPVVKDNQYQGNQPEPDQAQQPTVHFQTPDIQVFY